MHAILPCSLMGRSEESGCKATCYVLQKWQHVHCTWPTTLPSFSIAKACRSKEFSHNIASLISVRDFVGGGA